MRRLFSLLPEFVNLIVDGMRAYFLLTPLLVVSATKQRRQQSRALMVLIIIAYYCNLMSSRHGTGPRPHPTSSHLPFPFRRGKCEALRAELGETNPIIIPLLNRISSSAYISAPISIPGGSARSSRAQAKVGSRSLRSRVEEGRTTREETGCSAGRSRSARCAPRRCTPWTSSPPTAPSSTGPASSASTASPPSPYVTLLSFPVRSSSVLVLRESNWKKRKFCATMDLSDNAVSLAPDLLVDMVNGSGVELYVDFLLLILTFLPFYIL
jgi:hypothetical protein